MFSETDPGRDTEEKRRGEDELETANPDFGDKEKLEILKKIYDY